MVTSELMCMLCSTRPVRSPALALHPRWDWGSWPKVRTPLQGTIGEGAGNTGVTVARAWDLWEQVLSSKAWPLGALRLPSPSGRGRR